MPPFYTPACFCVTGMQAGDSEETRGAEGVDAPGWEIEVKAYAIGSLEELEVELLNRGAKYVSKRLQEDIYFNPRYRDFRKTDEALRIRITQDSHPVLTYKGPKIDGDTKSREEIQVPVNTESSADLIRILERLGFEQSGKVRKQRKVYRIDELKVCLDQVEGLGEFVEVEAKPAAVGDVEDFRQKKGAILQLLNELGLERTERRSYLELIELKLGAL